jgi:hypothetical protein
MFKGGDIRAYDAERDAKRARQPPARESGRTASGVAVALRPRPRGDLSQFRAASRAARAVFLCSAPLVGQPNAGLTGQGLRLACAEPGDQLAIFGEALGELTERATYLYEEAGRYWFSTQPTLNRLAEDLARALPEQRSGRRSRPSSPRRCEPSRRLHRSTLSAGHGL